MPTVVARLRRGERGQGLTEFALVGPLLFLLICGVFDFGRGMSANVTVTNSAREGARYIASAASQAGRDAVTGQYPWLGCPNVTANPPTAPGANTAQGKAWRQAQSANLDLTSVVMKVYLYSASAGHDPNSTAKSAADDIFTCTAGGVLQETLNTSGYAPSSGDWVQFEVDDTYKPITPMITVFISSVTMSQTTTMVIEWSGEGGGPTPVANVARPWP